MDGIRFIADVDSTFEGRAILAAARRAALQDIGRRIQRLEGDPNSAFQLDDDGKLFWHGARIAQLLPGEDILAPRIDVSRSDLIDNGLRERIRARLAEWLKQHLNRTFRPLYRARAESLRGPARGLVFQLSETLGALPEPLPKAKFHELEKADRQRLSRLGLRLGPDGVFFDRMLRGPALALRATLWSVHTGRTAKARATPPAHSLAAGNLSKRDWACLGYRRIGTRAIRFDRVARLGRAARRCARRGPFVATPELTALAGVEGADFEQVMAGLGFRSRHDGEKTVFRRKYPPRIKRKPRDDANVDPHSPFATLRDVVAAK